MTNVGGNGINKWLLFGLGGGLGLAGGIGLGYTLGKKHEAREASEAIKMARKKAYSDGFEDASAEAKAWIDENIVCVAGDTPEEIAENTAKLMKEKEEKEAEKNADKNHLEENNSKVAEEAIHDQPSKNIVTSFKTMTKEIEDFSQDLKNRVEELFLDGMSRADIARILKIPDSSVREWTKDLVRPNMAATDEDIENYDLSIDDESDSEEVEEMKEARERYLDHIDRYLGDPTEGPHYISAQDFNEATMLDQIFINYYEGDNTFVDIGDMNKLVDPVTDFGTADGKELFANAENREEPDTVHMCNMKMNAVYEITRYEQSYESIRDGSAFLNGNTVSGG